MDLKNKIYNWIYHKRNPDVPAKRDIKEYAEYSSPRYRYVVDRIWQIALFYSWDLTVEEIAENLNITRERVRQCLWKFYRLNRKGMWKSYEVEK